MSLKERLARLEAMAKRTDEQEAELLKVRGELAKEEATRVKKEAEDKLELEKARAENKELKRVAGLNEMANLYKVDDQVRKDAIADKTMDDAKFARSILDAQAKQTESIRVGSTPNREAMVVQLTDVVASRMGVDVDLKDNKFRSARFSDIARAMTGDTANFEMSNIEVANRAMATTDFPLLLLTAGNRKIIEDFDAEEHTYKQWVQEEDVQDFRTNTDITTQSAGGRLDKVLENGELKEVELGEGAETWSIDTFGNKFTITRKMIVNDDLNAFTNMLEGVTERAGNLANGMVYDLLRKVGSGSGYVMADGKAIFHADHGNLTDTVFDAEGVALEAGRLAMRSQVAQNGTTRLNIAPVYLHIPAELEQKANILLRSIASTLDSKNAGVINPFVGTLVPIVSGELSGTEWYLSAKKRTLKAGYLAGTGRRPLLQVDRNALSNTSFEGIFDFGVMAQDYRGLFKGK